MSRLIGGMFMLAACAFLLAPAGAQDQEQERKKRKGDPAKMAEAIFKKLDGNSDNRLSKDEFLKMAERAKDAEKAEKFKEFLTKAYDKADTDKKGLTLDQFKDVQKKLLEGFKGRKKKDTEAK